MTPDPNLSDRRRMVEEQIRARGITDERVLAAMVEVPRERFVPPGLQEKAFSDAALSIDQGQTISQPFMVAAMTASLNPQPHHRVLEVGTGSGYQAAVLSRLVGHVYSIERIEALQAAAGRLLDSLGITNTSLRVGDGSLGWPEEAPFDGIIVTAGSPEVPQPLVDQLVDGGRLVIPVGGSGEQVLTIVEKIGNRTREIPRFPCRFVKLIGDKGWPVDVWGPDPI